jgi:hypothetical protein
MPAMSASQTLPTRPSALPSYAATGFTGRAQGSGRRVGHWTLFRFLEWPLGAVGLLLYVFVLTGVPNVEDLSRRARYAAACRRSPWLTGIAWFFIAAGLVCSILYFV